MQEAKMFQSCGAIHIHTKFSDGTGDVYSVSRAAKKAGLDWIIVTDHNSMEIEEGIFNDVYVIKGQEISPKNKNHYLVLGANEVIEPCENPQVYVDETRKIGGFGFAAHPDEGFCVDEKGNICPRKNSHHCIPWENKDIIPDGIEIWNWFSNWADNLDDRNLLSLAHAFFFKHKIVKSPSEITLKWWDKLNNKGEKIIPALGGVDAHALLIKDYFVPLYIFPYTTCFKTINNIINLKEPLSKDFKLAKQQILSAVIKGNNLIINKNFNDDIPQVCISNEETTAFCGEEIILTQETYLNVETKKQNDIKVLLNGEEIYNKKSKKIKVPIVKKGKYRVELAYREKGFAYTNPIVVK